MSALSNLLIPAVSFFGLGSQARVTKSDPRPRWDLARVLCICLLMAIGLHGGYQLSKTDVGMSFHSVSWALIPGFTLLLVGYALLLATRRVDNMNAAAIAAQYGDVSEPGRENSSLL